MVEAFPGINKGSNAPTFMNQIRENYLALVNNVLELLSTQNKPAEFFILRDDGLSYQ